MEEQPNVASIVFSAVGNQTNEHWGERNGEYVDKENKIYFRT